MFHVAGLYLLRLRTILFSPPNRQSSRSSGTARPFECTRSPSDRAIVRVASPGRPRPESRWRKHLFRLRRADAMTVQAKSDRQWLAASEKAGLQPPADATHPAATPPHLSMNIPGGSPR